MNINRHNYEEFFLLYVDNELSAAEKKAVDVFVQENPDLQGELLLLQETVMKADDVVLEKKDWLFMEEGVSALQQSLLLYADDELTAPDKKAVEALLATDRSALAEWNILRQTKLEPDASVVFTDKQSLYRTERGSVVAFKWWRVAAAAVLLGFGLWTGITVYKNNFRTTSGEEGIAKDSKTNPGQSTNESTSNTIAVENQPANNIAPENKNTTTTEVPITTAEQAIEKANQSGEKIIKKNNIAQKDNIAVQNSNKKPSNNLPKSYLENINRKESNEIVSSNVLPEKNNNINASGINNVITKTNPNENRTDPVIAGLNKSNTDPTTIAAIPAVYNAGEKNNSYLETDDENGKRTKLNGFLRKAKRVIERTTNIKTGDGLQVAGFEIALK